MKIKPTKPNPLVTTAVKVSVESHWKSMSRTQFSAVKEWNGIKINFSKITNIVPGGGNERKNKDQRVKHWDGLQKLRQIPLVNTEHFQKTEITASSDAALPPLSNGGTVQLQPQPSSAAPVSPAVPCDWGSAAARDTLCRRWCTVSAEGRTRSLGC